MELPDKGTTPFKSSLPFVQACFPPYTHLQPVPLLQDHTPGIQDTGILCSKGSEPTSRTSMVPFLQKADWVADVQASSLEGW